MSDKSNSESLEVLTDQLAKNLSEWQKILTDIKAQKVLLPQLQERIDALQSSFQHQEATFDALGRRLETTSRSHAEEIESLHRQISKPGNDLPPIQQQLNELRATILNLQLEDANIQLQKPNEDLNRIIQMELDYKKSINDLDGCNSKCRITRRFSTGFG